MTIASSVYRDPHFYMFHSNLITFQGACDVVLSKSSSGADGFPFNLHARLTSPTTSNSPNATSENYTYISHVSLMIEGEGANKYLFQFGTEIETGAPVKLNGEHFASVDDDDKSIVEASSGLPFSVTRAIIGERGNIVVYTFTFNNGSEVKIRVNLHFKMLFIEVKGHFGGAPVVGILGNIFKKGLFNREGELMSDTDINSYGSEWQVRDDEVKLFVDKNRYPQYPDRCVIVDVVESKEDKNTNLRGGKNASTTSRRRLFDVNGGTSKFENDANQACAHLKGRGVQLCIDDVLTVKNIEVASDPFYEGIV